MTNATCVLPDCQRKTYCRGMCKQHYEFERGYHLKPKIRAKVTFSCEDCGKPHEVDKRELNRRKITRCPPCARKHGAKSRKPREAKPKLEASRAHTGKICAHCGDIFTARYASRKYCTEECGKDAQMARQGCRNRTCDGCGILLGYISLDLLCDTCKRDRLKARRASDRAKRPKGQESHRRRARHYGVDYEPINRAKVFDRDGWLCGICGDPISPAAKYPDLMSASLDHVIPLSRGGGHLYANVQASHFICNSLKGADIPGAYPPPANFTPSVSAR